MRVLGLGGSFFSIAADWLALTAGRL
uniref:Uncharacterized protein n=1 Tax=Anguilla anguilla TaxID=7936 RepID=A0A0E9UX24_ANGAN